MNLIEKIEHYLSGKLNDADKAKFEKEMKNDKQLFLKVEKHRLALDAIDLLVKKDIEDIYFSSKQKTSVINLLMRVAIAAVFIFIVGIGSNWYANISFSNEVLISENYTPRNSEDLRGNSQDVLAQGFNDYNEKKFDNAISFFKTIDAKSDYFGQAQLFLGYSYFEKQDYKNAINAFDNVIYTEDIRFFENAEWNKTLAFFANNDIANFQSSLKKIIENKDHSFNSEAIKLNKKMNSIFRKLIK